MTELTLMWRLLSAAPAALPHLRLFRRTVGSYEDVRGFHVKAGVPGQCDIYALGRGGRIFEIETKARRGKLSPAQERWRTFCLDWGIPHLVLSELPGEDADATIARWLDELGAFVRGAPLDWELAAMGRPT